MPHSVSEVPGEALEQEILDQQIARGAGVGRGSLWRRSQRISGCGPGGRYLRLAGGPVDRLDPEPALDLPRLVHGAVVQPDDRVARGTARGIHRDERLTLAGDRQRRDPARGDAALCDSGPDCAAARAPVDLGIQLDHGGAGGQEQILLAG